MFEQYIGVDYSGAKTPTSSLKGLRVYQAFRDSAPTEVPPPRSPRKYWTRHEVATWLVSSLRGGAVTFVGIDHAFSFPIKYFAQYGLPHDWEVFLDDFQLHWPTDGGHTRDGREIDACGAAVAAHYSPRGRREDFLLAVRWLVPARRYVRNRRSIPRSLEQVVCPRRSHSGPARRIRYRRVGTPTGRARFAATLL